MIQHEFITLTLAQFGQILKIPYNGQAVFTNEWDLASLEYSQETEVPYCTELPTPDDIHRLLELERVMVDHIIKSQTVTLTPNQILTKELSPDMKQWEELYSRECVRTRRTSGPSPRLSCSHRPRSDHGKACHSVSSSSSHHHGTSSHQHDDDDDDDDVETSRASSPSPTTYLNSLNPFNYQNYEIPSASEQ
ncbi:hypothetical protein Tco_0042458, partial [Tanacetum coccineum]